MIGRLHVSPSYLLYDLVGCFVSWLARIVDAAIERLRGLVCG